MTATMTMLHHETRQALSMRAGIIRIQHQPPQVTIKLKVGDNESTVFVRDRDAISCVIGDMEAAAARLRAYLLETAPHENDAA